MSQHSYIKAFSNYKKSNYINNYFFWKLFTLFILIPLLKGLFLQIKTIINSQ